MSTVLLVVHVMVAISMVFLILLQRSEGGALGMGGSSSGLVSSRGAANLLTRTTAILGALFFITSLSLGILGGHQKPSSAIEGSEPAKIPVSAPATSGTENNAKTEQAPANLPELRLHPKPAKPLDQAPAQVPQSQ